MVFQAQFHQIPTYSNITPKCDFHVFIFICIDFVDLFTDATQKSIVLSLQMQCSTEEFPFEGTEDCWVPPPLSQSFVACEWGSHSLHPGASLFRYRQEVKLLHLWPNKASEHGICHHARRQLMPPLKVPAVSRCLITSLLRNLYTII
jgi:hypothetical protein